MQMKSNMTYFELIPCFRNRFAGKKWLPFPAVYNFSCQETAAIFFLANLFLKQGISSKYVMFDFICFNGEPNL